MKGIANLLFLCICFFKTNAQITLTRADFPDSGDVIYYYTSPDSTLSPGPSGANVTWDFSQLHIEPSPIGPYNWSQQISPSITHVVTPSNFPYADYLYYYLDSLIYIFVKSRYIITGPSGYTCDDSYNEKLFSFPFNYNDHFIDSFQLSSWCTNTSPQYRQLIDSVVCDGYGTLLLPFGTFDVLRVFKEKKYFPLGSSTPNINISYTWYTNNNKCPLLISYLNSNGSYGFSLQNLSSTIGISENSANKFIYCFYLGVEGRYIIQLSDILKSSQVNFSLNDLQSRKINFTPNRISDSKIEIDINNLSSGIYFLNVYGKGFNQTFKLMNNN